MYICAALDFAAVIIKPCSTALLVQRMLNALPLCLLEGRAEDVMIFVSWLRSLSGHSLRKDMLRSRSYLNCRSKGIKLK